MEINISSDLEIALIGAVFGACLTLLVTFFNDWLKDKKNLKLKRNSIFIEHKEIAPSLNQAKIYMLKGVRDLLENTNNKYFVIPSPLNIDVTRKFYLDVYVFLKPAERRNISNIAKYTDDINDLFNSANTAPDSQKLFDFMFVAYRTICILELYIKEAVAGEYKVDVDFDSQQFIDLEISINKLRDNLVQERN